MPQPTIAYGAGNASAGAQTSLTVTLPTHQTGDLLIVQLDMVAAPTVTRPALWNVLRETANSTFMKQGIYYKVATSGAETNPNFTIGATARVMTGIGMRIRDADVIVPPNGSNGMSNSASGNTAGPHTVTGLTIDQPTSLVVFCTGKLNGTDENIGAPTNYTEGLEVDNSTTIQSEVAVRSGPPLGATGSVASTGTVIDRWVATMFFVRSADYATYRSHVKLASASIATATFTLPTGVATNDILFLLLEKESTAAITAPGGWTVLVDDADTSGGQTQHFYVAWKRHTGGDAAPSFTWTGATWRAASLVAYYRCPTSGSPVDVQAALTKSASTATLATASATLGSTLTTHLGIWDNWMVSTGTTIWTPGSGTTERIEGDNVYLSDKFQTAGGSTGTMSATANAAGKTVNVLVALKSTASQAGGAGAAAPPPFRQPMAALIGR